MKHRVLKPPKVIFEVVSEGTAQKDETIKFELYRREGIEYYVIAFLSLKKTKVYKLHEGKYVKLKDVTDDSLEINLEDCSISLDFSKIW
nr:Uma2 family endonuclease [Aquifex aeolicus]